MLNINNNWLIIIWIKYLILLLVLSVLILFLCIKIIDFKNLDNWQNSIGFVPQNIIIINQSLKENVLFGSDKKLIKWYKELSLFVNFSSKSL